MKYVLKRGKKGVQRGGEGGNSSFLDIRTSELSASKRP